MHINDLINEAHQTAIEKGWWEKARTFAEQIALMHSELSEALEEQRTHGLEADRFLYAVRHISGATPGVQIVTAGNMQPSDKPEGIAAELADVLIRIADTCGRYDIPLKEALEMKLAYNKTRPYRHGGKQA